MLLLNKLFVTSLLALSFSVFIKSAISQELKRVSINPIGTVLSNKSLSLSQSVGQSSIVTKFKSNQTLLSQGFQQPNSSLMAGIDRELNVQMYPNPNNGQFQFSVGLPRDEKFDFFIYDQVGRIISKGNGEGSLIQKVDISDKTSSGSYHLKVKTAAGSVGNSKLIITK